MFFQPWKVKIKNVQRLGRPFNKVKAIESIRTTGRQVDCTQECCKIFGDTFSVGLSKINQKIPPNVPLPMLLFL